ncbi:hypothetical protein IWW38_006162 [Coemansia aciculifera]|uniref:Uncharacterized protein n=1 Tax=Coemansia aciculifera TaxID=417176 RepID=A0ACC1LT67_9FUNG|nr:hypothetical protein IWW38_006162 [Coemansia aciculifera]
MEKELVSSVGIMGDNDHHSLVHHQLSAVAEEEPSSTGNNNSGFQPFPTCGAEVMHDAAGDYFGVVQHSSSGASTSEHATSSGGSGLHYQQQQTTPTAAEWRRSAMAAHQMHLCHQAGGSVGNMSSATTPLASPSAYVGSPALASPPVK